jgi:hypothetical protein
MARISVKPLNSGRFALMERTHDFGLIPWRPAERYGRCGGEGISRSVGIKRCIGR